MKKIYLEIITPVLTFYSHCEHCMYVFKEAGLKLHEDTLCAYPDDVQKEYFKLSELVREVQEHFGSKLLIRVIDPTTLEGIYKSIKYWSRKYPLFVINGKEKRVGWQDIEELKNVIAGYLS